MALKPCRLNLFSRFSNLGDELTIIGPLVTISSTLMSLPHLSRINALGGHGYQIPFGRATWAGIIKVRKHTRN